MNSTKQGFLPFQLPATQPQASPIQAPAPTPTPPQGQGLPASPPQTATTQPSSSSKGAVTKVPLPQQQQTPESKDGLPEWRDYSEKERFALLEMSADDGLRMQFLDYLPRYPIHRSEGTIDMVSLPRGMLFWRCEGLETRVDAMDRSHILLTLPGAMMAHAQNVAVEAEHSDKATVVPVVLTEPISLLDLSSPRTRETMNRIAPQIIASKSVGGTVSLSVGVAITSFTFGSPLFLALLLPLAGIAYSAALRGGVHVFPGNKLPSNMASDRIAMEYIDPNGTATTAAVQDSQENHHNPNGKRRRQKKEKRKKRHVFVDDDPRSNDPAKRYALNQALSRAVCGIPKSFVLHGYTSRKPIVYSRHWTTVPRLGRSPHTKAASPSTQEFPGTLEDFDEILLCPTSLKSDAAAFRTVSMSEFSPALRQAIHAKIGALERLRKSKSQVPNEFPKK